MRQTDSKSEIRNWTVACLSIRAMSADAKKAEELERRFVLFAAQIVDVSSKMPRTFQGRHISRQIMRSGTATASNYGEARGAESRTDFVHKLKIVLKELNETAVWLQLIRETSLLSADKSNPNNRRKRGIAQNHCSFNSDSQNRSVSRRWFSVQFRTSDFESVCLMRIRPLVHSVQCVQFLRSKLDEWTKWTNGRIRIRKTDSKSEIRNWTG
jgi:four helix bundle protein